MKRMGIALAALLALALVSFPALAWIRSPATTFATLPTGATPPEGLTTGPNGDVYASTFGFPAKGPTSSPGQVIVFDSQGKLLRQMTLLSGGTGIPDATPHLLGLAFNPVTHDFLVLDFGAGKVLRVNPLTGAVLAVFADIGAQCSSTPGLCPVIPPDSPPDTTGTPGLNALTFDGQGKVYVSDSFQGIIWQIPPGGGTATAWVPSHSLLTPSSYPPFGANGLAFNKAGNALFVANTANDSVVRIPVSGSVAGTPAVLAYSINGADGLIIDDSDNIWVCANQSDEIVVVEPVNGKVIAKLGDFDGIDNKFAARGLLFPASLVFSGQFVLVTNLVLDTTLFGFPTVDSQWARQVMRYTVSKINRNLPPTHGDDD
jgi:DNA-binding beta-propeller fold protein YncE